MPFSASHAPATSEIARSTPAAPARRGVVGAVTGLALAAGRVAMAAGVTVRAVLGVVVRGLEYLRGHHVDREGLAQEVVTQV